MKFLIWEKDLGTPVAEIEIDDISKINIIDPERFTIQEIKEVQVEDTVNFG